VGDKKASMHANWNVFHQIEEISVRIKNILGMRYSFVRTVCCSEVLAD
jgi:hypothetical protein